jgi:hypothetical protein
VTIGSDSYCVQCATNEDCGVGGTCNTSTYACEGGTVTPTEKCEDDSDCDPGGSTGFVLTCHKPTGLCVDASGQCDDVTAFCVSANGAQTTCVSFFEMFGAGGGVSLPPELAGGGTIPGFCSCTCDIPGLCIGPGDCRPGTGNCADLAALLSSGTTSNPVCFDFGF